MGDGVPFGQGWAATALPEPGQRPEGASVAPLLDAIAARVPPPGGDPSAPFALLVAMVEHDAFLGPVATGRVAAGTAAVGDRVRVLHHAGAGPAAVPQLSLSPHLDCFACLLAGAGRSESVRCLQHTCIASSLAAPGRCW